MELNKIKNTIWEVVGLALGVLFLLGIVATFVGAGYLFFQYKRHSVEGVAVEPGEEKSDLKLTVQYEIPLPVEGTDFLIIPVTLAKKKQAQERERLREVASSSSYDRSIVSDIYSHYWGPYYNLVFINKKTGESRLLLTKKGYIEGIYLPEKRYDEKEPEKKPTFLILKIATVDTNKDGIINGKDATAGFIASLDGTKLTQVTPDNTQMGWWRYAAESQMLFMEVVRDVNNNRKFNWDDPKAVLSVNILDPKMGQEFVTTEIKNEVETILKK